MIFLEDEDTLTSNKESTHAPVKLVFSDPGGIEGKILINLTRSRNANYKLIST